jgi:predicted DNA-binding transcriptional regulator YafY
MSYGNAAKLLRVATRAAGRMGVTLGEIAKMCECDRRTARRITVALSDLFPETERWTDDDVDEALASALKSRRHIRMLYSSWGDAAPRWREVAPHGLLLGTRRYLVAHDVQRGDKVLRHYRVEGILQVEILVDSFAPDPGFDLAAHAKAGFSSCVNAAEVEEVVWRFSAEAADRARRFVFHPDQIVVENDDGTITVTFSACGLHEMCWHLYSWSDKVEVIEPEILRLMVADHRRSDFTALP